MGSTAFGALYPEDLQRVDMTIRCPDLPFVVGMDGKAARMPAGTGELMELEGSDHGIIIILGKTIAIFDSESYHSSCVYAERHCGRIMVHFARVGLLSSYSYSGIHYDSTTGLHIK